jgi:hypothetical protein
MKLLTAFILGLVLIMANASSEEPLNTIQAADILKEIQNGQPVELDHVRVVGDLILSNLSLPVDSETNLQSINSPIRINDSIIEGIVDFKGSTFGEKVNFQNTNFKNKVDFSNSELNGPIGFINAVFDNSALFTNTTFSRFAHFKGAKFNAYMSFANAKFLDIADLSESQIVGDADFTNTYFASLVSFFGSQFNAHVRFNNAKFNGNPLIWNSDYGGIVDFNYSKFNGPVYFTGANFRGKGTFNSTSFSSYVIDWKSIKNIYNGDIASQLALIKNFRDHGQFNDADECYLSYRLQYMKSPFDYLSWLSCGFGVKPIYPLIWSVFSILIFGILFFYKKSIQTISKPQEDISGLDAFYFSAMIFFVSHPPTDWRPSEKWKWSKLYIFIEDVLGWMLLTLFIVTLTSKMMQ